MIRLSGADYRALLGFAEVSAAARSIEDVRGPVMQSLAALVGAEVVAYTQGRMSARTDLAAFSWPNDALPGMEQMFQDCIGFHGPGWLNRHPVRAAVPMPPLAEALRMSDFLSTRQWHEHPVYRDAFRRFDAPEDQVFVFLGADASGFHQLSLHRSGSRQFSDRHLQLVELATPHVREAARRALATGRPYQVLRATDDATSVEQTSGPAIESPAPVLTPREREVVALVAEGLTSGQIARRLGLAVRTVEKHLEHAHQKLQVNNRIALIAAYQEILWQAF